MRILILMAMFWGSLSVQAGEVLDLGSYFPSVKRQGMATVYIHDVYDSNRISRFVLVKTAKPTKRDGKYGEELSYSFGARDASGNIVTSAALDEDTYNSFRAKIEFAKMENSISHWTHGCMVRAVIGDKRNLINLVSLCGDEMKIPAENPAGTIEADAVR